MLTKSQPYRRRPCAQLWLLHLFPYSCLQRPAPCLPRATRPKALARICRPRARQSSIAPTNINRIELRALFRATASSERRWTGRSLARELLLGKREQRAAPECASPSDALAAQAQNRANLHVQGGPANARHLALGDRHPDSHHHPSLPVSRRVSEPTREYSGVIRNRASRRLPRRSREQGCFRNSRKVARAAASAGGPGRRGSIERDEVSSRFRFGEGLL
jgi:hypothetical protein